MFSTELVCDPRYCLTFAVVVHYGRSVEGGYWTGLGAIREATNARAE